MDDCLIMQTRGYCLKSTLDLGEFKQQNHSPLAGQIAVANAENREPSFPSLRLREFAPPKGYLRYKIVWCTRTNHHAPCSQHDSLLGDSGDITKQDGCNMAVNRLVGFRALSSSMVVISLFR